MFNYDNRLYMPLACLIFCLLFACSPPDNIPPAPLSSATPSRPTSTPLVEPQIVVDQSEPVTPQNNLASSPTPMAETMLMVETPNIGQSQLLASSDAEDINQTSSEITIPTSL